MISSDSVLTCKLATLVAGIAMLGGVGAGLGVGTATGSATKAIARQPEAIEEIMKVLHLLLSYLLWAQLYSQS